MPRPGRRLVQDAWPPLALRRLGQSTLILAMLIWALNLSQAQTKPAQVSGATYKVWEFKQRHYQLGDIDLLVAPDGFKLVNAGTEYSIVAKAPTWRVVVFRPRTKTAHDHTYSEWCQNGFASLTSKLGAMSKIEDLDPLAGKPVPTMYAGVKALHYIYPRATRKTLSAAARAARTSDYWMAVDVPTAKQTTVILEKFFKLEMLDGIPLCHKVFGGKNVKVYIDTSACNEVAVGSDAIAYPRGYKQVSTDFEVLMDPNQTDDFNDFAEQMGIGEKFGTKRGR